MMATYWSISDEIYLKNIWQMAPQHSCTTQVVWLVYY